MYKKLLDKGFKLIRYTNTHIPERMITQTKLVYRLQIECYNIISKVLKNLGIYNRFSNILETDNHIMNIEFSNNLKSCWIYFDEIDNKRYEIFECDFDEIFESLPNVFDSEYVDDYLIIKLIKNMQL